MSWQKAILNPILKVVEKGQLARAKGPRALRKPFELKAKLFFHAPRGTEMEWFDLGGAQALRIAGEAFDPERVILYFHGGGHVFGSPKTHSAMLAQLAKRVGCEAILPVYPLSPESVYPASLTALRAVYDGLLAQGMRSSQIVIGGDSAGGSLAMALLAQLLRDEAPLPAGVFAFSPLTDLTFSGASFQFNADADVFLPAERASEMAQMYLDGQDPTDPFVSPVFADFTGAPPVWLTVGDTEILLDDTRRLAANMKKQGVDVQMHIERDLPHVWPILHNVLPEGRATLDRLAGWINRRSGWGAES
jgi:monoterpene epsilon-lactone hydrolase